MGSVLRNKMGLGAQSSVAWGTGAFWTLVRETLGRGEDTWALVVPLCSPTSGTWARH